MIWGSILAVIAGGLFGWWWGSSRTAAKVNRQWMTALEKAKTDNIIDEDQSSQLIRIQDAQRQKK